MRAKRASIATNFEDARPDLGPETPFTHRSRALYAGARTILEQIVPGATASSN